MEMPGEYGSRLVGQAAAARAILAFTGKWGGVPADEYSKGICYAAESMAAWAHERFGIEPDPGKCPCFCCNKIVATKGEK